MRAAEISRTKALLVAVLVFYVAVVVGLMTIDRATFVGKTAAVPAVVVVALLWGRASAFVRDWAPFLGGIILFDSFRGLVFSAIVRWDLPYYAGYVIKGEHAVLGGTTLPHVLQQWWLVPGRFGILDAISVAVHASHFVFFLLFGVVVWRFRRPAFARFQAGVLLLLGAGLALYALVPTVPPWMAASSALSLIPPVTHVLEAVYGHDLLRPLTWTFDLNPIAAMPSLHAAFPMFCTIFAVRVFGRRGLLLALYTGAVCIAVGYLGEHYLVDIAGGVLLAMLVDLAIHSGPAARRLASDASPLGPVAWHRLRAPLLMGLVAILAAELVGQASIVLRGNNPFHTRGFIQRELAHTERASLDPVEAGRGGADRPGASRLAER